MCTVSRSENRDDVEALLVTTSQHPVVELLQKAASQPSLQLKLKTFTVAMDSMESPTTIESAAHHLIQEPQARCDAEFTVIGVAESCLLAYEVAHRLLAQGAPVTRLVLINSAGQGPFETDAPRSSDSERQTRALEIANSNYRAYEASLPVDCFAFSAADERDFDKSWRCLGSSVNPLTLHLHLNDKSASASLDEVIRAARVAAPRIKQHYSRFSAGIELRRGIAESSVFLLPGAGDTAISLFGLIDAVPSDWPVFGLHQRGLEGGILPFATTRDAVGTFVTEITRLAPGKAIHLLGHSLGGLLAIMTARELHARGVEVSSIFVLDSEMPAASPKWEYTDEEVISEYLDLLKQAAAAELPVKVGAFTGINSSEMIKRLHAAMITVGLVPARSSADSFLPAFKVFATSIRWRIERADVLGFTGKLTVCMAMDSATPHVLQTRINAWRVAFPQATVVAETGNHISILKAPHNSQIKNIWKQVLKSGLR